MYSIQYVHEGALLTIRLHCAACACVFCSCSPSSGFQRDCLFHLLRKLATTDAITGE